ncbi:MAG: hypothetical protein ACXWXQ_05620 [Actinomycetota bacterium]
MGKRPWSSAADALGGVRRGEEAAVFVLGLDPTPGQRRITEEALAIAEERRFTLIAELIAAPPWLWERLRVGDQVRVLARRAEVRRWRVKPGPVLSPPAVA